MKQIKNPTEPNPTGNKVHSTLPFELPPQAISDLNVDESLFKNLDAIAWDRLAHAYGPAIEAPQWIRALASEDEEVRNEAVNGFLHSAICHQYSVYSATPFVIPFVITLLQQPNIRERPISGGLLKQELLGFLRACTQHHPIKPEIRQAIIQGHDTYVTLLHDADQRTAAEAGKLVAFCGQASC
ncbi:MAG: hypothetical protein WCR20_22130 [Verrucomicrobiota bacterium]